MKWLRDRCDSSIRRRETEAAARRTGPDTQGVYLVPAFTGLGAPHWEPDARGIADRPHPRLGPRSHRSPPRSPASPTRPPTCSTRWPQTARPCSGCAWTAAWWSTTGSASSWPTARCPVERPRPPKPRRSARAARGPRRRLGRLARRRGKTLAAPARIRALDERESARKTSEGVGRCGRENPWSGDRLTSSVVALQSNYKDSRASIHQACRTARRMVRKSESGRVTWPLLFNINSRMR